MPFDGRAADAVESRALAAGRCGAFAPQVVVERVVVYHHVVPVAAHVCAAVEGGRCCCEGGEGQGEELGGEFHFGGGFAVGLCLGVDCWWRMMD